MSDQKSVTGHPLEFKRYNSPTDLSCISERLLTQLQPLGQLMNRQVTAVRVKSKIANHTLPKSKKCHSYLPYLTFD